MTAPIIPNPAPAVPQYPALGSAGFNQEAFDYGTAMPGITAWIAETVEGSATNAEIASGGAVTAVQAAADAASVQSVVLATANFAGVWADMSGPLNRPACVKHNGRFWMLLNDLPNVAASQPGVSADWTSLDAGRVTARITANTTAVAGVYYVAATSGITLTVPANFAKNDYIGGRNASGGNCNINWGTNTLCGDTPEAPMGWPANGQFEAYFDGVTFG